MKKFYTIKNDSANKKYFEITGIDNNGNIIIEEANIKLINTYPFEIDVLEADKQIIVINGKQYYRSGARYLIPMEYVYEISREEYIQRTLDLECQYDSISNMVNDNLKSMAISEFAEQLKQAFINKVYIISINPYIETPYSDFVKYACDSLVKATPHLIYIDEITSKEIQLWLELEKPGYFIGKCGEVINFWTKRLNNILKLYNPEYTLSIRIKEMQTLIHKDCQIIL